MIYNLFWICFYLFYYYIDIFLIQKKCPLENNLLKIPKAAKHVSKMF